jgi:hypothetical protein
MSLRGKSTLFNNSGRMRSGKVHSGIVRSGKNRSIVSWITIFCFVKDKVNFCDDLFLLCMVVPQTVDVFGFCFQKIVKDFQQRFQNLKMID